MKAFDAMPDGTRSPDVEFNERFDKLDKTTKEIEKEQEETNHGLNIELRHKIAAHFLRVEFPEDIVEEIKTTDPEDNDFRENLTAVLDKVCKTYLKRCFDLEKKLDINWTINNNSPVDIGNKGGEITFLLMLSDEGTTDFSWGMHSGSTHPLTPGIRETVEHESGVLLVYPSFVDSSSENLGLHIKGNARFM